MYFLEKLNYINSFLQKSYVVTDFVLSLNFLPLESEFRMRKNITCLFKKLPKTRSDVAIYLTLPYTSGRVWYKGLDFHFLPPPPFWGVSFCIFSVLGSTDYVYKIWLSLLKWPGFPPPLNFGPRKKYFRYYRFIL